MAQSTSSPPALNQPGPDTTAHDPTRSIGHQNVVVASDGTRILCVADIRGDLALLNTLAASARASIIIHTGDFGFYDVNSLQSISEKTLRHVMQYSPLIPEHVKKQLSQLPAGTRVQTVFPSSDLVLSQFPRFLQNELSLSVPVYTVWGSCEDVAVLEKLRAGLYKVPNLHVIDEAHSRLLAVGGVKLRLFGLGGAMVMHRLFDVGEGRTTIAGGQGTMWTTVLQMGELLDTAARVYDPSETRVLVTHASPSREGLLIQLASALKADLTISAGLHFRYGSSYNEFSVSPSQGHYVRKLVDSRNSFDDVWETVESAVTDAVSGNEGQQRLLNLVLDMVHSMPQSIESASPADDSVFKITWNFNLADAAYGSLILNVVDGRIATEMRSEGFNFGHRAAHPHPSAAQSSFLGHLQGTAKSLATSGSTSSPQNSNKATSLDQDNEDITLSGSSAPPNSSTPEVTVPPKSGKSSSKPQDSTAEPLKSVPGKALSAPTESQSTPALFVRSAKDEADVLGLLDEQDKSKGKVLRYGGNYAIVFSNLEDMRSALDRIADEFKHGGSGRPQVAIFRGRLNLQGTGTGNATLNSWESESEPRRGGFRTRGRGGRGRGKQ